MKRLIFLCLLLVPGMARAEFALSDMVGTWAGTGSYTEALSKATMKCRLTVTGDDARVTVNGRCGSSLGADDVTLDFVRQSGSRVVVEETPGAPKQDSEIEEVSGNLTATQLFVRGAGGDETVAIQFVKNDDGTLYFATERTWKGGDSQSRVTLSRR